MKKSVAHVTDHAVLRYLERVEGLDIERLRRLIGRRVDRAMEHEGASGLVVGGVRYKLRGHAVTTVILVKREGQTE